MKLALFTIVCPALLLSAVSLCTETALLPNGQLTDGSDAVIPAADTIPPVIIFNGGIGVNKDTVIFRQGDPERVLGTSATVSATDTGSSTSFPVALTNSGIFTSQCGIQYVLYTATDAAGNSTSKTRVIIVDCDPPVITLAGDNPLDLTVGGTYTEPGATAIDNIDGPVSVTTTGIVHTTNEHIDTIIYSALDRAGNVAIKKRLVIVGALRDTTPPVIALHGGVTMVIRVNDSWVEPGWVAFDIIDGDITMKVRVTEASGKPLPVVTTSPATYTLVYSVSDSAGNSSAVSREVKIVGTGVVPRGLSSALEAAGK